MVKGGRLSPQLASNMRCVRRVVVFVFKSAKSADTFSAFDCQDPQEAEFFGHDICNKHSDKLVKEEFTIVQKRGVTRVKGFSCLGKRTTIVGYCGRYSHNKFTGEDSYGIPILFSHDECQSLVATQVYSTEGQTFPLQMSGQTFFTTFSHGSVSYTGSNIACTGGEMRLSDGSLNTDMIQQVHYSISIYPADLIQVDHEILDPYTQTSLGMFDNGFAYSYSKTFIWSKNKPECQMLKVMDLSMESTHDEIWYNDRHEVQLKVIDSFYDQSCKIKLSKTDAKDLYLTPVTNKLEKLTAINVDLSIDTQIRFDFVNSKLAEVLRYNYKNGLPVCSKIRDSTLASTSRSGESTFVRNLGDASIEFSCKKVDVAPIVEEVCYSMLKVQDLKSTVWFLDPESRILMKEAVVIPCSISTSPIYRNTRNELVSYSPGRKNVNPTSRNLDNSSQDNSEAGIYPKDMVRSWLNMAFLQHLSRHSYSLLSQAICQSKECMSVHTTPDQLYGYIGSAVYNMQDAVKATFSLGVDWEIVGGRCSIAICFMVSIYVVFAVVSWFVRYALFKTSDVGCLALIIRATCPSMFLISKATEGTDKE